MVSEDFTAGLVADGSLHRRQCPCGVGEQLGQIAPSDPEGAAGGIPISLYNHRHTGVSSATEWADTGRRSDSGHKQRHS